MASKPNSAFVAYPGSPADLEGPITLAGTNLKANGFDVTVWPALEPFGANIPDEVRDSIEKVDVLFADVTRPNLNVYYEIGYAIGLGKTVAPIVNASFAAATASVKSMGVFANIGYKAYEPEPKVVEQYQHVVIHASLRRDGVNGDMDWYCPARA